MNPVTCQLNRFSDKLIHIKNNKTVSIDFPGRTYCRKIVGDDVKCRSVADRGGFAKITCNTCKRSYVLQYADIGDMADVDILAFTTFEGKDFRGKDFRSKCIVGCRFIDCQLDGMLFRSIYLTHGTEPYDCRDLPDYGYRLEYTGVWPRGRDSAPHRGNRLGSCLCA